jgi:[protein-PII] uridylyltransferase
LGSAEEEIQAYFDMMPRRYFIAHAPRQIARHAAVVFALGGKKALSTAVREMRGDFSEFILCTKDVHGLYAKVAGVLTAHQINVLGAHVYTARSGLALEVYRVTTPPGGEQERRLAWEEIEQSLELVWSGAQDVDALLERRGRRVGGDSKPSSVRPASVVITNDESDFYTIADVTANDRIGLLYALTKVIADLNYEIYISKAATVLDQVQDTFYLKDTRGKKIVDPAALERLQALLTAAARGESERVEG